jgi:hypothetical protein
MLDHTFVFSTDTATLAIFDPEVLGHRVPAEGDWWTGDFLSVPELLAGDVSFLSLGDDGVYKARITSGSLTDTERDYANEVSPILGIRVQSGTCFAGHGEAVPGEGFQVSPGAIQPGQGTFIPLPKGLYDLRLYRIAWSDSPRWWGASGLVASDAPPELVITASPRSSTFLPPASEPRLLGNTDTFLFPSSARVVGPIPGLLLPTEVRKAPAGLTLKACGPCGYKPSLRDYRAVSWRDRIVIRVVSVDHASRTMMADLEHKTPEA